MLQVARYLLKSFNRIQRGSKKPLGDSVSYLKSESFTLDTDDQNELRNSDNLIKAYINNSCQKVKKAGEKLLQGITGGLELKKTWDELAGIDLVEASTAHSYYWMVKNFYVDVTKIEDRNTRKALGRVFLLYAIEKIIDYSTSFFETNSITAKTFIGLRKLRETLYSEIRPDALCLVEAFGYTDHTLMSAIGSSDGKPYENLLDWARNSNDVNKPEVRA
jgi:acyl-CoA oxidase